MNNTETETHKALETAEKAFIEFTKALAVSNAVGEYSEEKRAKELLKSGQKPSQVATTLQQNQVEAMRAPIALELADKELLEAFDSLGHVLSRLRSEREEEADKTASKLQPKAERAMNEAAPGLAHLYPLTVEFRPAIEAHNRMLAVPIVYHGEGIRWASTSPDRRDPAKDPNRAAERWQASHSGQFTAAEDLPMLFEQIRTALASINADQPTRKR